MKSLPTPLDSDAEIVESFRNFLSWEERPSRKDLLQPCRNVPPAWWAYARGFTLYCPPNGTM